MIEWFRVVTRLKILGGTTWLLTKLGHYIKNLHFWYNLLTFSDNCGASPTSAFNGCSTTVIRIEKKNNKEANLIKHFSLIGKHIATNSKLFLKATEKFMQHVYELLHCVKSGKYKTEKAPYLDTFHAVICNHIWWKMF